MSEVSEDKKKLIASMLDAINGHDPDAMLRLVHPECEFHARFAALEGRVYQGSAGFHEYFRDIDAGFAGCRWEADEARQASEERLFVVFRFTAVGRASGVPIDRLA